MIARQRIVITSIVQGNQQRAAVNKTFLGSDIFASLERVEFGRKGRAPGVRRDDRLD